MEMTTAQKTGNEIGKTVLTDCFSNVFYQFGGVDYQFGDSNYQFGISSVEEIIFSVSIRWNVPRVSESLIDYSYQFGISSGILYRDCR